MTVETILKFNFFGESRLNLDKMTHLGSLEILKQTLMDLSLPEEKLKYLDLQTAIQGFNKSYPEFMGAINRLHTSAQVGLKSIIALGQAELVYGSPSSFSFSLLEDLGEMLSSVEIVYQSIGGVVGYYLEILKRIQNKETSDREKDIAYLHPEGIDLSEETPLLWKLIRQGIEGLPNMGEMYPVGGAGDRLNLQHPLTGESLPASQLRYCGKSLLEGLIRDLQAKEYVYFKLLGQQLTVPLAIMTSTEKNNHEHMLRIFQEASYFGRPQNSYRFFIQPSVPVITVEGDFAMEAPLRPIVKPGGHGVIWKLALEAGVFDWLNSQNVHKVLIRQINNPISGVDGGLLAFVGNGLEANKDFGFSSCPRLLNTPEGMDVCMQRRGEGGYECCMTNVEYTDFAQKGLEDVPREVGSPFSKFPANTNILFADLNAVQEALQKCSLPGMLINMKTKVKVEKGAREVLAGRLETTMQNIADYLTDRMANPILPSEQKKLRTYITFNKRRKTLSVTKQLFQEGQAIVGTPEGAFYEKLQNDYELLKEFCKMQVPAVPSEEEFIQQGPSFIFHYHPALGPLYSIIGQKIRGGSLSEGAELDLEIAEANIENLFVTGSLLIQADHPLGMYEADGILRYGNNGRCILKNVTVQNAGIDHPHTASYWERTHSRLESLLIRIVGNGEFIAENVRFEGNQEIVVPDGYQVRAFMEGEKVCFEKKRLEHPSWKWSYAFDADSRVKLSFQ